MNYGYEFESKLLACLLNDTEFLTQIGDVLKPEHFNNQAGKWLATVSLDYYKKYRQAPSLLVFKTEIENLDSTFTLLKQEAISFLGNSCAYANSKDLPYVKEQAVTYCRDQEIKSAILESVDLLKKGEYDKIKLKLDTALKVGMHKNIGHLYIEDLDKRYEQNNRKVVSTHWEAIDDMTQGGMGEGELAVIIAPGGVGKSWVLSALGARAVQAGKVVVHYTLELNKFYVAKRYDSILSGIPGANLDFHKEAVYEIVTKLPGNLIVEEYPTKTASVLTLEAHLDRCLALGYKPDLIIVDYGALLKGSNSVRYLEVGEIYEELRGLAGKYKCPVWTAAQARREALEKDIIEADDVAEAYSIIAVSDFVMSLSRKIEDKLAGTGRFHVIKNRNGPDGITLPSRFNASNGKVDIFFSNSREAVSTRKDMDKGETLLRKELGRKYFDQYLEMTGSKPE